MQIAEKKKQNNVAEYIIHMYQTEDLIRVYEFDMELIKEYVIKHIPQDEVSKEEIIAWYTDILKSMQDQKLVKKGHLAETQKVVTKLETMKDDLVKTDDEFKKIYLDAKVGIDDMMKMSEGKVDGEIQLCLNAIYGLLIARINGREVPADLQPTLDHFGNVLSYLSYKYKQDEFMNDN